RSKRDWSSDVCSSDLTEARLNSEAKKRAENRIELIDLPAKLRHVELANVDATPERENALNEVAMFLAEFKKNKHIKGLYLTGDRSEERRVGKESRTWV